nr:hypothetical protein [Rubripirellula sp.]
MNAKLCLVQIFHYPSISDGGVFPRSSRIEIGPTSPQIKSRLMKIRVTTFRRDQISLTQMRLTPLGVMMRNAIKFTTTRKGK